MASVCPTIELSHRLPLPSPLWPQVVRAKDQALRALQSLVLQQGEGPHGTHGAAGQRTPSHPSAAHDGRSVQCPAPPPRYASTQLIRSMSTFYDLSDGLLSSIYRSVEAALSWTRGGGPTHHPVVQGTATSPCSASHSRPGWPSPHKRVITEFNRPGLGYGE